MRRPVYLALQLLLALPIGAATATLDLAGEWRLRLDPEAQGRNANWPATPLAGDDRITLPNTTDRAGFGFPLDTNTMRHAAPFPLTTRFPGVKDPQRADEHGYLVRRHLFVGPAWYEREIVIPEDWRGTAGRPPSRARDLENRRVGGWALGQRQRQPGGRASTRTRRARLRAGTG